MISNSSTSYETPPTLVPGSDCISITRLRIRAFRAIDEPHTCLVFMKKHCEVLESYGLEMITSNNDDWPNNPNVYVLVAESLTTGEMIGGARVHVAKSGFPLPIEDAIGDVEPKIVDLIKQHSSHGGVGELCGLWNSLHHKKIGLGVRLGRSAIAFSNQLKLTTLMAIVGRPTLQSCLNIGFVESEILGDKGTFPYPKKDLLAWALGVMNAKTLETASALDKKFILELREKPCQLKKEQAGRLKLEIDYQLNMERETSCIN
tara:strand:+ start:182 stop:964 length:783 start_codon:yes stop_codon:yes gene_type:complete